MEKYEFKKSIGFLLDIHVFIIEKKRKAKEGDGGLEKNK
jgi:hypothetical protein